VGGIIPPPARDNQLLLGSVSRLIALDPYVTYPIDFKDALMVAHMERQTVRELYSYDRDFDEVPGVNRQGS